MTDPTPAGAAKPISFYDAVGGTETFRRLVAEFYTRVEQDPVLLPLYPPEDLAEAPDRLRMFLEQYWGGPKTYGEQRGHPRLRMRHVIFRIGAQERDAWLRNMREALDVLDLPGDADTQLWAYLQHAAHSMVNATDPSLDPSPPQAGTTADQPQEGQPRVIAELTDRPDPGPAQPG